MYNQLRNQFCLPVFKPEAKLRKNKSFGTQLKSSNFYEVDCGKYRNRQKYLRKVEISNVQKAMSKTSTLPNLSNILMQC